MPRAGRPPLKRTAKRKKPSILKYIDGSKDSLPEDEPTPDLLSESIAPPEHFTDEETGFFREAIRNLLHMKLMTVVDLNTVIRYAELQAAWADAQRLGKEHGWYFVRYEDETEQKIVNAAETPWLKTVKDLTLKLLKIEGDFGFTPSSRTYISTESTKEKELDGSIEAFIQGRCG